MECSRVKFDDVIHKQLETLYRVQEYMLKHEPRQWSPADFELLGKVVECLGKITAIRVSAMGMIPEGEPEEPGPPEKRGTFTPDEAHECAAALGVDWSEARYDAEQFREGMIVELEHGTQDGVTDVTGDDALKTAKIALAHLREFADYYDRLKKMEHEDFWKWLERAEKYYRAREERVAEPESKAGVLMREDGEVPMGEPNPDESAP